MASSLTSLITGALRGSTATSASAPAPPPPPDLATLGPAAGAITAADVARQLKALRAVLLAKQSAPVAIPCLSLKRATSSTLTLSWNSPSWQIISDSALAQATQCMYVLAADPDSALDARVADALRVDMGYQLRYFKTGRTLAAWTKVNADASPILGRRHCPGDGDEGEKERTHTVDEGLLPNTNYTFEARACVHFSLSDAFAARYLGSEATTVAAGGKDADATGTVIIAGDGADTCESPFAQPRSSRSSSSSSSAAPSTPTIPTCMGPWSDWSPSRTNNMITRTVEDDEHAAYDLRLQDYLQGALRPYPLTVVEDTKWLKAERVGEGTLQMVSRIPFLGDYGKFVKTAKVLWDSRHVGLAALIFADDLQKIAAVLATLAGSVKADTGLTTKDITVGAYYLLWLRRGERAGNPDGERDAHAQGQRGVLLERAPSDMLRELAWFAPLAFASYERTPDRVQWLVDKHPRVRRRPRQRGKRRRKRKRASKGTSAQKEQAAAAAAASASEEEEERRRRGHGSSASAGARTASGGASKTRRNSSSPSDDPVLDGFTLIASSPLASKVTSARATPVLADGTLSQTSSSSSSHANSFMRFTGALANVYKPAYNLMAHRDMGVAVFSVRGTSSFEDVLVDASATAVVDVEFCGVSGTCHGGILSSAIWLAEEARVLSWMKQLHADGGCNRIVFTGHSLGAGVALLLALMLKTRYPEIKDITVYGYAMPAVVDEGIADVLCDGRRGASPADGVVVRCLINRDDIVSRLSLSNAKSLAQEILARRPHWEPLLSSDLNGVYERAKTLWAPNQRQSWDAVGQQKVQEDGDDDYDDDVGTLRSAREGGVSTEAVVLEATRVAAAASASTERKSGKGAFAFKSNGDDARGDGHSDGSNKAMELRQPTPDILKRNTERARLVVPGAICHIYDWRGQSRCALVDHRFRSLRRIEAFQTCIRDHLRNNMNSAMREVFEARKLEARGMPPPPPWEPMSALPGDEVCCCVCGFHVTWALTGKASTETARATHHCRACGKIVCKDCSSTKMSLPQFAILSQQRVCDLCANRGCLESFEDLGPMPLMWNGKIASELTRRQHLFDARNASADEEDEEEEEEEGSEVDDSEMWEDAK